MCKIQKADCASNQKLLRIIVVSISSTLVLVSACGFFSSDTKEDRIDYRHHSSGHYPASYSGYHDAAGGIQRFVRQYPETELLEIHPSADTSYWDATPNDEDKPNVLRLGYWMKYDWYHLIRLKFEISRFRNTSWKTAFLALADTTTGNGPENVRVGISMTDGDWSEHDNQKGYCKPKTGDLFSWYDSRRPDEYGYASGFYFFDVSKMMRECLRRSIHECGLKLVAGTKNNSQVSAVWGNVPRYLFEVFSRHSGAQVSPRLFVVAEKRMTNQSERPLDSRDHQSERPIDSTDRLEMRENLKELKTLYDKGYITKEIYENKVDELLDRY